MSAERVNAYGKAWESEGQLRIEALLVVVVSSLLFHGVPEDENHGEALGWSQAEVRDLMQQEGMKREQKSMTQVHEEAKRTSEDR